MVHKKPPKQTKQSALLQTQDLNLNPLKDTHYKDSLQKAPKPVPRVLSNDLEEWAKQLFNTPEQGVLKPGSGESPTTFLSRFGLKTPSSVAKFLISPAGEALIHKIAQDIEFQNNIQHQIELKRREHQIMVHRIKVALFLWYLNKKAHASKKLHELIQEQAEQSLARLEKLSAPSHQIYRLQEVELTELIRQYDQVLKIANDKYNSLNAHGLILENDLNLLLIIGEKLTQKYDLYEHSLLEDFFLLMKHEDGALNLDEFDRIHNELTIQMQTLQDEIDRIIESDRDPAETLLQLNALNLKLATMHDMKAVNEGKKFYHQATIDGKETHFVLNKGDELFVLNDNNELQTLNPLNPQAQDLNSSKILFKKNDHQVVMEHGKVYLLKPGQDWETVKDNPAMKEKAHTSAKESFARAKQEIMTVKHVIGYHKLAEQDIHSKRVEVTETSLRTNHAEKELVANQIRLVQSTQAEVKAALGVPLNPTSTDNLSTPTPVLRPSARPRVSPTATPTPITTKTTAPTPKPQAQMHLSFKEELDKLRNSPSLTREELLQLTNRIPGAANQSTARNYIQSLLANGATLSSASPQLRAQILHRMEQLGIHSPFKKQATPEATYTSPSPFNKTPKP